MCSLRIRCWCLVFAVLLINSCAAKPHTERRHGVKKTIITPVRGYRLIDGAVPDDLDSQHLPHAAVEEATKSENATEVAVIPQEDLKSDAQAENSIDKVSTEDPAVGPIVPNKPIDHEEALLAHSLYLANLLRPIIAYIRNLISIVMSFFFVTFLGRFFTMF